MLTKQEFRNLKSALTRAKNSNDPYKLLSTASAALARFDEVGLPDNWHLWQCAKDDALWALRMGRTTLKMYSPESAPMA